MTFTIFVFAIIWTIVGCKIFIEIVENMPDREDKILKQYAKILFISILLGPVSFIVTVLGGFICLLCELEDKYMVKETFLVKIGKWIVK